MTAPHPTLFLLRHFYKYHSDFLWLCRTPSTFHTIGCWLSPDRVNCFRWYDHTRVSLQLDNDFSILVDVLVVLACGWSIRLLVELVVLEGLAKMQSWFDFEVFHVKAKMRERDWLWGIEQTTSRLMQKVLVDMVRTGGANDPEVDARQETIRSLVVSNIASQPAGYI